MRIPKIFCISGLGADEMAFSGLGKLNGEQILIPWIAHSSSDTVLSYSKRIIVQFGIGTSDIVLGLSFGGLIAQQIGSIFGTETSHFDFKF